MIYFLKKLSFFAFVFILVISIGLLLPTTPRASQSLLFAKIDKDSLLKNTPSPRIIFIGGSNLSFGLNSQMIKDSLGVNPINTGIHASIGLIYMMDNSINYIRSGDVVIISPEYEQFYGNFAYGKEELLRTVCEVNSLHDAKQLRKQQWLNIAEFLPVLSFSKFKPSEYLNIKRNNIYSRNSFNQYGDVYTQWDLKQENFASDGPITDHFNNNIIEELHKYKIILQEKGAILFITFPDFQSTSFNKNKAQIAKVQSELKKNGFLLLGNPEKYKMPDSLMFNTPYHLLKVGVDLRTRLLIEDIRAKPEITRRQ